MMNTHVYSTKQSYTHYVHTHPHKFYKIEGPIYSSLTWLYYRGWPANTGSSMETLGPINLAVL